MRLELLMEIPVCNDSDPIQTKPRQSRVVNQTTSLFGEGRKSRVPVTHVINSSAGENLIEAEE